MPRSDPGFSCFHSKGWVDTSYCCPGQTQGSAVSILRVGSTHHIDAQVRPRVQLFPFPGLGRHHIDAQVRPMVQLFPFPGLGRHIISMPRSDQGFSCFQSQCWVDTSYRCPSQTKGSAVSIPRVGSIHPIDAQVRPRVQLFPFPGLGR